MIMCISLETAAFRVLRLDLFQHHNSYKRFKTLISTNYINIRERYNNKFLF